MAQSIEAILKATAKCLYRQFSIQNKPLLKFFKDNIKRWKVQNLST